MAENKELADLKRSLNSTRGNFTRALNRASSKQEVEKVTSTYRKSIKALEDKIAALMSSEKITITLKGMSRKDKVIAVFKAIAKEFNLEEGEIDSVIHKDEDFIVATVKGTYDQILETDFINIDPVLREFMINELDFIPFEKRKFVEDTASERIKNSTFEDCIAVTLFTKFQGKVDVSVWKAEACCLYKDIHHTEPGKIERTFNAMVKLFSHPNVRFLIKRDDEPGNEVYELNLNAKVN